MITNLHIKNIGIIDDLDIKLNKGMNVLTGETGAGKTLIIDAINIICGGRFSKEMIRKGESYSYIEICMFMPDDINSVDGNIIITREIYINGRNMCKINGRMVTVAELKTFMSNYIEIHGQDDNNKILDNKIQKRYLDNFSGENLLNKKIEYEQKYQRYNEIKKELKANYGDEKERQRKLDLLRYQKNEINEAELKIDEEKELEEKSNVMKNSEKIIKNLSEVENLMEENIIDSIGHAVRAFEKIENVNEKYKETSSNLRNIYYELQEISSDTNRYIENIEFNEQEREKVEIRLDIIDNLKRKYGDNIDEILKYSKEIEEEIRRIENISEYNEKLRNEKIDIEKEMTLLAKEISEIRKENAEKLTNKINEELVDLEMKNAKINIKVKYYETEYFADGKDEVVIYVKTNIGEDENELVKIASGGEKSRIILALKKVLADADNMPTIIFDEIDTGISGKASKSVASKIKSISKKHQVLCISHLAPVTAIADYNYFISKEVENDRTNTNVKLLDEKEVLCEIARISSGEINDITLKYASEMRNKIA